MSVTLEVLLLINIQSAIVPKLEFQKVVCDKSKIRLMHHIFGRLTLAKITNSGKMFARQGVSLELFAIELASPKKYNLIPAFSSANSAIHSESNTQVFGKSKLFKKRITVPAAALFV